MRERKTSPSVYFSLLAIITMAGFALLFPSQKTVYEGSIVGKMGVLVLLLKYLGGLLIVLFNLINTVVSFVRRKYRLVSLGILGIGVLAVCWSNVLKIILPYDTIVFHRSTDFVASGEFQELRRLYPARLDSVHFTILPQDDYFVTGDYVINVKQTSFGKIEDEFRFFSDYYAVGDAQQYPSLDSLVRSLPYHLDPRDVRTTYDLMKSSGLSDVYVDSTLKCTVYAWEQSAYAGTRGVILTGTVDRSIARSRIELTGKLERMDSLSPGIYYIRIAPDKPF